MPNQQIFPQSVYPASGDVLSEAGSALLRVIGIQQTPFSPVKPTDGQVPRYSLAAGRWEPSSIITNDSISVNGVGYSDDYTVWVNDSDTTVQVNSSFPPNGFPILVEGLPAA